MPRLFELKLLFDIIVREVHFLLITSYLPRAVGKPLRNQARLDIIYNMLGIRHDVEAAIATRIKHLMVWHILPRKELFEYLTPVQFTIRTDRRWHDDVGLPPSSGLFDKVLVQKHQSAIFLLSDVSLFLGRLVHLVHFEIAPRFFFPYGSPTVLNVTGRGGRMRHSVPPRQALALVVLAEDIVVVILVLVK